jgi:hypothetical protein
MILLCGQLKKDGKTKKNYMPVIEKKKVFGMNSSIFYSKLELHGHIVMVQK